MRSEHTAEKNKFHMGVFKNSGTPKSSILIGFSITNHPFWSTPIVGSTHIGLLNEILSQFVSNFSKYTYLLHFFQCMDDLTHLKCDYVMPSLKEPV